MKQTVFGHKRSYNKFKDSKFKRFQIIQIKFSEQIGIKFEINKINIWKICKYLNSVNHLYN